MKGKLLLYVGIGLLIANSVALGISLNELYGEIAFARRKRRMLNDLRKYCKTIEKDRNAA